MIIAKQINPQSLRLAVLLLAAGEGSRLGSHPKVLLLKDGETLLARFCKTLQSFNPVELVMVTGYHAEEIEADAHRLRETLGLPITITRNPTPERGQGSSVRLGLESLRNQFDVLLVALSDQPSIGGAEVHELLHEYCNKTQGEEIILPMVNGQRGNPVLFSTKAIEAILQNAGMVCRTYMDTHPHLIRQLQTSNQAYIEDVDTLEDIAREGISK